MAGTTQGKAQRQAAEAWAALRREDVRLLLNIGVEPRGVAVIDTVAEAIRDLCAVRRSKAVPSGELYAHLMPTGITLGVYNQIIVALKTLALVNESAYLLTWIGPVCTEKDV